MRALLATFALIALTATPATSWAREFTKDQQKVWSAANNLLEAWVKLDMDETYEWVHPDFVFWNSMTAVPGDYDVAYRLDKTTEKHGVKWLSWDVTPLTVYVNDDVAIVNAYIRGFQENTQGGAPAYAEMRFHGTFQKHDGRWKQLANYMQLQL